MRIEKISNQQLADKLRSLKIEPEERKEAQEFDARPVMNSARVLISLGRISVMLGVILSLFAALVIFYEIPLGDPSPVALFTGGLSLLISGLIFVAAGRVISCLVAIERNTRGGRMN
jgi:hypothetical protein